MRTTSALAAGLLLCLAPRAASASTDTCYYGGPLLPDYTLNGTAALSGTDILVTPDLPTQNASVFFNPTFSSTGNLHIKMVFKITTTVGGGADGLAFVMHSDPRGVNAIGQPGEGIGYGQQSGPTPVITPSVVVEFDTYLNGARHDPSDNHIGVTLNGDPDHSSYAAGWTYNLNGHGLVLKSNAPMYAWMDYDGTAHTLAVYLNNMNTKPGAALITANVNLNTRLGATFWMGFSGSTGGSQSKHEVLEFYASDTSPAPDTACCLTDANCATSPNGPLCDPTKHVCGQCTIADTSKCAAQPSACDLSDDFNKCVPNCDGNFGSGSLHACASKYFPVCRLTGPGAHSCFACDGDNGTATPNACAAGDPTCSNLGYCGFCSLNSDCTSGGATHSGAFCNTTSGRCVACLADGDCTSGNWCNNFACVPKIANGGLLPGTCAALGARACVSGVCEASDNICGYLNHPPSNGLCSGNAALCRSGKCDPDGYCGLANGDGACAAASQATDCRSGLCDTSSHLCGESKGTSCTADGDCSTLHCADTVCCDTACSGECDSCNLPTLAGLCSPMSTGAPGSPSCAPYLCDGLGAICPTTCGSDLACASGNYCDLLSHCVPKLDDGTPCGGDNECKNAHCVDGVCCNSACGGACDACNLLGSVGTCSNVLPGAPGAPACAPYLCDGTGPSCPIVCTTDLNCVAGYYCDGLHCQPLKDDGTPCGGNGECKNAHCVDGVCCNSACAGACDACNLLGSVGTCSPDAPGSSGAPSCSPYLCDGVGAACPGTCANDASCVSGFYCDLTSHCVPKNDDGTPCGGNNECKNAHCVDGVCCNSACGAACDACNVSGSVGTCSPSGAGSPGAPSCTPYLCDGTGTACPTACASDANCAAGYRCDGTNHCVPKSDDGTPCSKDDECLHLHCVDSVCCDTACTGQCEACNLATLAGKCSPAPKGPPLGSRPVCAGGGTCAGSCDGSGRLACSFPGSSLSCRAASCTNGVGTLAATCDGAGGCPAASTVTCSPFVCGATACLTACATGADCIAGDWCSAPSCLPKLDDGQSCSAAEACKSGFCTDGVCCHTACTGECEACDATPGTCLAVTGAPHGSRPACQSDGSACGGKCDGTARASCAYPTATDCRAASCVAGTGTLAATCDGKGDCPLKTVSCSPYICGPTACLTSCSSNLDCEDGAVCEGKVCKGKLDDGAVCKADEECKSDHCVDGVCCDTACHGQCQACAEKGSVGTCTAVTGTPRGSRGDCVGSGVCQGTCDGKQVQGCVYPGESFECRAASCTADVATLAAGCDSAGNCPPAQTQSCAPHLCADTRCAGDCVTDQDCDGTHYCAGGLCQPKIDDGKSCGADHQCLSGFCVDGVCCDKACQGQCEACVVATLIGKCSPVTGSPQLGRPSCAGDGSLCSGACGGTDRNACAYPADQTECRAAACANGIATLRAGCDGAGNCPALQTEACAGGACDGKVCIATGCKIDKDCPDGQFCASGICKDKLVPGRPCAGANQCLSGFCVDDVCCGSACPEECEACNVAGKLGTCSPVTGAPHGARPVCLSDGTVCGGVCDGQATAACAFPDDKQQCRAAACTDRVATLDANCDGKGACPAAELQSCVPYACMGTICGGNCTLDEDCSDGYFCSAGVCQKKKPAGQTCLLLKECLSALCVDGLCCDKACDGQCEACDRALSPGTCGPVTGDPHGSRASCSGQGACKGKCDGTDAKACVLPGAKVTCADPSCTSGASYPASTCDGKGACLKGQGTSCVPFTCGPQACLTTCSAPADCAAGFVCSAGQCQATADGGLGAVTLQGGCGCSQGSFSGLAAAALIGLFGVAARRRRRT